MLEILTINSRDYLQGGEEYNIKSKNWTYRLKLDLKRCSCEFFSTYGLPCRHILFFHEREKTEVPAGCWMEHWNDGCPEVNRILLYYYKSELED